MCVILSFQTLIQVVLVQFFLSGYICSFSWSKGEKTLQHEQRVVFFHTPHLRLAPCPMSPSPTLIEDCIVFVFLPLSCFVCSSIHPSVFHPSFMQTQFLHLGTAAYVWNGKPADVCTANVCTAATDGSPSLKSSLVMSLASTQHVHHDRPKFWCFRIMRGSGGISYMCEPWQSKMGAING